MHDTYLPQYQRAFEGSIPPYGVMCSYNAENGRPSCANSELLDGQLRAWSPDAIVSTDCGAINNLLGPPVNATVRYRDLDEKHQRSEGILFAYVHPMYGTNVGCAARRCVGVYERN